MKKIIRLFAIMGIVSLIASCGSNNSNKNADNEDTATASEKSGDNFEQCENPTAKMFIGKWESAGLVSFGRETWVFELKEDGKGILRTIYESDGKKHTDVEKIEWHIYKGTESWNAGINGIFVTHFDGMELTAFNINKTGDKLIDVYTEKGVIYNRVKK